MMMNIIEDLEQIEFELFTLISIYHWISNRGEFDEYTIRVILETVEVPPINIYSAD